MRLSHALWPSAVRIGDVVCLRTDESTGLFIGDFSSMRCGALAEEDPANIGQGLFRVFPALGYRVRTELRSREREMKQGARPSFDKEAEDAQLRILESRLDLEEQRNDEVMEEVEQGARIDIVKYASVVQLQHVQSGKFLACHKGAAPIDRECRRVSLKHGSLAAHFRLLPRYRAQTEGSSIYYGHSLKLEAVKLEGMFVHVSAGCPFSELNDPADLTLPSTLREGRTCEINCAPHFTTFAISLYSRTRPEERKQNLLQTLDPVRLFHSQAEAFIHASSDPMKGQQSQDGAAEIESVKHVPYLKSLLGSGDSDPDPRDARNQSAKGIWAFEGIQRFKGGGILWGAPVKLKHVPSHKYLAVIPQEQAADGEEGRNERWFDAILVDGVLPPEEPRSGSRSSTPVGEIDAGLEPDVPTPIKWQGGKLLALEGCMTFAVQPAESTTLAGPTKADCGIDIAHRLPTTGEVVYLHGTGQEKRKKKDVVLVTSFRIVFSSMKSSQDILKCLSVQEKECTQLFRLQAFISPFQTYSAALRNPRVEINEDMQRDAALLLEIIRLVSKGFAPDLSIDWIQKANSMLPTAFAQEFGGECDETVQRMAREIKLIDAVFEMGLAPYDRYPTGNPFGEDQEEGMDQPRGLQKLIHIVLQKFFQGNQKNQQYFSKVILRFHLPPHPSQFVEFSCATGSGRTAAMPKSRTYYHRIQSSKPFNQRRSFKMYSKVMRLRPQSRTDLGSIYRL